LKEFKSVVFFKGEKLSMKEILFFSGLICTNRGFVIQNSK